MRLFPFLLCLLLAGCSETQKPVRVIFDSDMGPDYDDVGAITLLHAFADMGEAEILATVASTNYEGVASVFDILNTYFGRPDLPIGVARADASSLKDFQHWTDSLLARYPYSLKSNAAAQNAVKLYRRILSQQPDRSVTIITVGFLTNIAELLRSGPDELSPLGGMELVKAKAKRMICMAGGFPSFQEFNIKIDAPSAKYVFENFPGEVIFSGFEIGNRIKTGLPLIHNDSIRNSPVKDVYKICIGMSSEDKEGRKSWDQTAVLVAVRGPEPWYNLREGRILVDEKGFNTWDSTARGQFYLKESAPVSDVNKLIDELMQHQPSGGK